MEICHQTLWAASSGCDCVCACVYVVYRCLYICFVYVCSVDWFALSHSINKLPQNWHFKPVFDWKPDKMNSVKAGSTVSLSLLLVKNWMLFFAKCECVTYMLVCLFYCKFSLFSTLKIKEVCVCVFEFEISLLLNICIFLHLLRNGFLSYRFHLPMKCLFSFVRSDIVLFFSFSIRYVRSVSVCFFCLSDKLGAEMVFSCLHAWGKKAFVFIGKLNVKDRLEMINIYI